MRNSTTVFKAFLFVTTLFLSIGAIAQTVTISTSAVCQNASGTFNVTITNGGNATRIYTITLRDDANTTTLETLGTITTTDNSATVGTFTLPSTTAGNFRVRARFNAANSANTPFTVNATPAAAISPASITAANGSSFTLIATSGTGFTYSWKKKNLLTNVETNLIPTTQAIADIASTSTPSVRYSVTISSGSCSATATSDVSTLTSLPIDIISFDAKAEGKASKLSWRTGEEKNVDFFILERSKNGKDFVEIAKMKSGAASKEYSYMDEKAFAGTSYYRLKMPENDGSKVMFSKTISVSAATKGAFKITPTLANDNITLDLPENLDVISLHVTDFSGRIIKTIKTSSIQERVDVSDLASGMYFIVAQSGADKFTQRFVKQ